MAFPENVRILECVPRDGWQNHHVILTVEQRIKYIKKLIDCGIKEIECGSFVNPKYVPTMANSAEVISGVKPYAKERGVKIVALALNKRGVDDAIAAGPDVLAFGLSASEEHNLRNSRTTVQNSMESFKEMARYAADKVHITFAIMCAFGSPFGDDIPLDRLKWMIEEAKSVGVKDFGFADSAGISTPYNTRKVLRFLIDLVGAENIELHLHDSEGMGLANAYIGLEEGISRFDASLAAMGGCPFIPGAKGNIATEDIVNMCHKLGVETGLNLRALVATAKEMCTEIQAPIGGSMCFVCHDAP